jgi:hypothetical protein
MNTVDVININTDILNEMESQIDSAFIKYANTVANKYSFGTSPACVCKYYRLWLAKRVLKDWQQAYNGDPEEYYNTITQEQFVNIITTALNIAKK